MKQPAITRTIEIRTPKQISSSPCAPGSVNNRVRKHILYSVSGIVGTVRIDNDVFTGTADECSNHSRTPVAFVNNPLDRGGGRLRIGVALHGNIDVGSVVS
jgi:hypothetical protein